jgi:hypothetical protein
MHPGAYNNNVQIFQTPENVAILNEMIHDTRIVPLDGRLHGHVRNWRGDSRGHWKGDTLVIDSTPEEAGEGARRGTRKGRISHILRGALLTGPGRSSRRCARRRASSRRPA